MSSKNIILGYTKSDLTNFLIVMILSFVAIPLVVKTDYWYSSILIPWLCLALAAIGQQIVMGYAGQLALGAAGFMAAGAFACFNLIFLAISAYFTPIKLIASHVFELTHQKVHSITIIFGNSVSPKLI